VAKFLKWIEVVFAERATADADDVYFALDGGLGTRWDGGLKTFSAGCYLFTVSNSGPVFSFFSHGWLSQQLLRSCLFCLYVGTITQNVMNELDKICMQG